MAYLFLVKMPSNKYEGVRCAMGVWGAQTQPPLALWAKPRSQSLAFSGVISKSKREVSEGIAVGHVTCNITTWKCRIKCHVLLVLFLLKMFRVILQTYGKFLLPENLLGSWTWQVKAPETVCEWLNHSTNTRKSTAHHPFKVPTLKQLILLMGVSHSAEPSTQPSHQVTFTLLTWASSPPRVLLPPKCSSFKLGLTHKAFRKRIVRSNGWWLDLIGLPPNFLRLHGSNGNFFLAGSLSHSSCDQETPKQKLPKLMITTPVQRLPQNNWKEEKHKKHTQKIDDQTNENKQTNKSTLQTLDLQLL